MNDRKHVFKFELAYLTPTASPIKILVFRCRWCGNSVRIPECWFWEGIS